MLGPLLQERPLDHLGHLRGLDVLGDAEIDGHIRPWAASEARAAW